MGKLRWRNRLKCDGEIGCFYSSANTSGRYGEYYRACRARGMGHGRALKAVARKRLRAIYAVMRDRVPYRE